MKVCFTPLPFDAVIYGVFYTIVYSYWRWIPQLFWVLITSQFGGKVHLLMVGGTSVKGGNLGSLRHSLRCWYNLRYSNFRISDMIPLGYGLLEERYI